MDETAVLRVDANHDHGAAMVEYGLILALVVLVALIGVVAFGGGVSALWDRDCDQYLTATQGRTCT